MKLAAEACALDFLDAQPVINVQEAEYVRLLGYPRNHAITERGRELMSWAQAWYAKKGRPWIYGRTTAGVSVSDDAVRIENAEFVSDRLAEQFRSAEADGAVIVAVSAGVECEEHARQCWEEGKPDEYFFMEVYGSAVVEYLVTQAAARICAWADTQGLAVLPHYSPGYTGWPVSDQLKLWPLFKAPSPTPLPHELTVMASGMLRPKKSLLAVFGLTRNLDKVQTTGRLIPCENCSLPHCQYRRSRYRYFMPQTETFNRETAPEAVRPVAAAGPVLDKLARYSVNARALKKWSQERLNLEFAPDGSVIARFRYEGTTCSNSGFPIHYDYVVKLLPRAQLYRIAEATCGPVPGDVGHVNMCEYLKDPDDFMAQISAKQALLGRPLNDVLSWKRPNSPAGCYCEAASREHKWGMVFEVIHYALAQRGAA